MRVVHIITGLGVGGAESMLLQLIRALGRSTDEHVVLTLTSANAMVPQFEALNVTVTVLRADRFGGLPALIKARKIIHDFKPNLVMTWLHHSDLFGVMLKSLMPSLPLVWNIRCSKLSATELPRRNLLIVRLLSFLSWIPDAIVANSMAGKREHIAVGYRRAGWRILPNGFDTVRFAPNRAAGDRIRAASGIPLNAFVVGLVGRYHPMKGFDLFMEVAGRLAKASPAVHFVLAGDEVNAANAGLKKMVATAGIEGRITLLGQRSDIGDVMNVFDVTACTSTSEGFSNVIGEAMLCGVPCVATDVGDNAVLVGAGGRVVPAGDAGALAAAITQMIEMPPQSFHELKGVARAQIVDHFAIENIARRYQELFDEFAIGRDNPDTNIAPEVVAGFGAEWARFDQQRLETAERDEIFHGYFGMFPWDKLGKAAVGADVGCGSGRWAKVAAPLVEKLNLVDASSQALDVARQNLAGISNVTFVEASVGNLPFDDNSLDFAYSLGVLHHVPDTQAAVNEISRVLKPGAPFLVYLYYAFGNRPWWYRWIWRLSDSIRAIISKLPLRLRHLVCDAIAVGIYWPVARLANLVERIGINPEFLPLAFYRDKSFYTLRTDSLDRFGTGLEKRFTRRQIAEMLETAGFSKVQFSPRMPYWVALAYKVGATERRL